MFAAKLTARIARFIDANFGPNASKTAADASRTERNALARVDAAAKELATTKSTALTTLRASDAAIAASITAEREAQQERAISTDKRIETVVTKGETEIAALAKTMAMVDRNTAAEVAELEAIQSTDDSATSGRITGALSVRDRLTATADKLAAELAG